MSQGPCGLGRGTCEAAGAAVAVANVTPIGKSAIAKAAARVLRRVRRMGGLNMSDKLLSRPARTRALLVLVPGGQPCASVVNAHMDEPQPPWECLSSGRAQDFRSHQTGDPC